MATHAPITSTAPTRRAVPAVGTSRRRRPSTAELRVRLEAALEEALAALDALDCDPDMEPDDEGEEEPGEAWGQPATLAPDRAPARIIAFPRRLRRIEVTA